MSDNMWTDGALSDDHDCHDIDRPIRPQLENLSRIDWILSNLEKELTIVTSFIKTGEPET